MVSFDYHPEIICKQSVTTKMTHVSATGPREKESTKDLFCRPHGGHGGFQHGLVAGTESV